MYKLPIPLNGIEVIIVIGDVSKMCMILSMTELNAYLNSFLLRCIGFLADDDVLDSSLFVRLLDLAKYPTIMIVSVNRIMNGNKVPSTSITIGNAND